MMNPARTRKFRQSLEQGLGGDLQGQCHSLLVYIENLPRLPLLEHAPGVLHHGVTVATHPRRRKSGCCQTPLLVPELPLAGEQPLTEDRFDMAPEEAVLDEVLVVFDQDILH
jgi:hypothetical protein